MKNVLLLRTDRERMNAWHNAAYSGKIKAMKKIWDMAKKRLTTKEIKMKYYYAQTMREGTSGKLQLLGAT